MKKTVFLGLFVITLIIGLISCDFIGSNNNERNNPGGISINTPGLAVFQLKEQSHKNNVLSRSMLNRSFINESLKIPCDDIIVGGGVIVYVRDMDGPYVQVSENGWTAQPIPVTLDFENNQAIFHTNPGHEHMIYMEFFLDGLNNTGLDGAFLSVTFTATESDEIAFYVNSGHVGLFANGIAHESNIIWYPDNNYGGGSTNPENRVEWRERNFSEYNGVGFLESTKDGYVARFLVE